MRIQLSFLAVTATSCGLVSGGPAGEIKTAKTHRDVATLERLCRDLPPGNEKYDACQSAKALNADVDDGNCEALATRYEASSPLGDESDVDNQVRWGHKFAKCHNYKAIFEQVAARGDYGETSSGVLALVKLEADQLPVVAEFLKYAKDNSGPKFLSVPRGPWAAAHIGDWLSIGKHKHCSEIASAVAGASVGVQVDLLFYFTELDCTVEGRALAEPLLESDKPGARAIACNNLAKTGTRSNIRKLEILATTDEHNTLREERGAEGRVWATKVYPVREACRSAIGKIELRGN